MSRGISRRQSEILISLYRSKSAPRTTAELVDVLEIDQVHAFALATVRRAMQSLAERGFVEGGRVGKESRWSITPDGRFRAAEAIDVLERKSYRAGQAPKMLGRSSLRRDGRKRRGL